MGKSDSASEPTRNYRRMSELPPGATLVSDETGTKISLPLWRYWLQIADENCARSVATRSPDAQIDALSAALATRDEGKTESVPDFPEANGTISMKHAMAALAAAAHAIDGFYGTVKPLIALPVMKAARHRQILETLKLGFAVGGSGQKWATDLEWLFDTRDGVVHHSEELRQLVVTRVTEETIVTGGPEGYQLTSGSAARAAALAHEVIETCLANSKPSTKEWAERASL